MTRILCLRLPNWPVQRLCNARPELKRRAVAIYEERQGCRIVASSRSDLLPGTPVAEATGVHLERYDPFLDRSTLERIAVWCEQFCPLVGLEETDRPSSLFFDISGLSSLIAGERELAEQILRAFSRRDLQCQLAIADTPGLAWAVTHDPESPRIVAPGDQKVLCNLAIETLRLPFNILQVLRELGIQRVGQILALPRTALMARFGQLLLDRLDQLTGAKPEMITAERAVPEILARREFENPVESRSVLAAVLQQLVTEISAALAARQLGAIQLSCQLKCENEEVHFIVGLFEASGNPRHLQELVAMQLEQCLIPGPVSGVCLAVLLSARLIARQRELFVTNQNHTRDLALLIDRLSSRLGREAVLRALLGADAQPEYAFRYEILAGRANRSLGTEHRKLPLRPLFLTRPPLPLAALSIAPAGAPVKFRLQGGEHRILRSWGPERIQTGWWRGQYIRRDYYRVECDIGQHYWLFRSGGKWFLHGVFA
ncbi:DNA polymerase IV [Anatilimnocola aggregata]|uniref:DNA polymerase IV n=1 Tax=Anatilimnocola aggregata TaxID=2528021 RepID=A0A517YCN3_9BACT|nr:DNA polymerase Y family protein [Anatilimnocola aggregata]QDU27993.1 DNA polymerase IV [Anatilimnocola aggregata]